MRWLARLASDGRALDLDGLSLTAAAMGALRGPQAPAALAALATLLEHRGEPQARAALEAWARRRLGVSQGKA